MWPLMLGGAALQYGSALDQGTAARNANSEYQTVQNGLNQNLMGDYAAATPQLQGYSQGWQNNVQNLIQGSNGLPSYAQGMTAGTNAANSAVGQAQKMGAGYGTDYNSGDTANSQVKANADQYYGGLLKNSIAQEAQGTGQAQMQYGQRQAGMQYGQNEANVTHGVNDLFNKLAIQQALYGDLSQNNLNTGNQNMRSAAGVGRSGAEAGQLMGLAGLGMGAMGSASQFGGPTESPDGSKNNGTPMFGNYYSNSTQGGSTNPFAFGQRLQGPSQY